MNNNQQQVQQVLQNQNMMKLLIGETKGSIKAGINFAFTILPIILFASIFREVSNDVSRVGDWYLFGNAQPLVIVEYWVTWLICIGWWVFILGLVYIAENYDPKKRIKKDMYISVTSMAWMTMGFMLMYINNLGWWRIAMSILFLVAATGLAKIGVVILIVKTQAKKAMQMFEDAQQNPMYQQFSKSMNQQPFEEMVRNIQNKFEQGGFNIKDLQKQFEEMQKKAQQNPNNQQPKPNGENLHPKDDEIIDVEVKEETNSNSSN